MQEIVRLVLSISSNKSKPVCSNLADTKEVNLADSFFYISTGCIKSAALIHKMRINLSSTSDEREFFEAYSKLDFIGPIF